MNILHGVSPSLIDELPQWLPSFGRLPRNDDDDDLAYDDDEDVDDDYSYGDS